MAIFGRRHKQSWHRKLRESVWPSMGWARAASYYWHRVFRTGDSSYKITAGLAAGISISFSPLLGTHFLQVFALTTLLRANWIAGFVGTAAGNPWTFPFLFTAAYVSGVFLCGLVGLENFIALPDDVTLDRFMDEPFSFLAFMFSHPLKFLLPMVVGGYACALLCFPLAYAALYYPVRAARKAYVVRRLRRRRARRGR